MRVLALSPHTDDIELGCGGYLSKLHEQGHEITAMVFSDCSTYWGHLPLADECRAALSIANARVHLLEREMRNFKRQEILDFLMQIEPYDMVLLPSSSDIHQDHQVIHNEGVRAFSRRCNVLAYELPYNSRGFTPSYFVELKAKHMNSKMEMLKCYKSQIDLNRPYFDPEFIRGHSRSRGLQIKKEFAEAFEVITWIV